MKTRNVRQVVKLIVSLAVLTLCIAPLSGAQQQNPVVPTLVNFSGVLTGANGKPLTGTVGVTFALYQSQEGGVPLWLETQNVQPDKNGNYSVMLGSTTSQGLPSSLFASGQARWLGVQAQDQEEQPRVLLLSVPYALKALDAETIGGKPASSFMLAPAAGNGGASPSSQATNITGSGTKEYLPMFTGTTTIGNSKVYQNSSGNIGIATTTPAATLDVSGSGDVRDTLTLFPKSTHPTLSVSGTAFEVSNKGLVTFVSGQTFPGTGTITGVTAGSGLSGGGTSGKVTLSVPNAGITNAMLANSSLTVSPGGGMTGGGKISLGGSATLGLENCSANQVLEFVSGAWTCTNAGTGTITGVTAGTDLTGGGTSGKVTLNLDTTKVPQLAANNTFSGTQTINNNVTVTATGTTLTASGGSTGLSGSGSGLGVYGTSSSGFGVYGLSSSGDAVYGTSTSGTGVYATSSSGLAVYGESSSGTGMWGESDGTSVGSTGVYGIADGFTINQTYGVIGNNTGSDFAVGVYGQDSTTGEESGTGESISGSIGAGVWGDGGADWSAGNGNVGVIGTADDESGVWAENNATEHYTLYAQNDGQGFPFYAGTLAGNYCNIDANGDLSCSGTKNAVVPIDGGQRKVALSAIESPKNWFEDFGSAQLSNGSAVVAIDPEYAQTVNTEMDYKVFPVPNGECNGLYVTHKTATSFEVRELHSGTSSVSFDYRIIALRKNYENIRMKDHTNDPDPRKMMARRRASGTPFRFETAKMKPPLKPAVPMPHPPAPGTPAQITEQK